MLITYSTNNNSLKYVIWLLEFDIENCFTTDLIFEDYDTKRC